MICRRLFLKYGTLSALALPFIYLPKIVEGRKGDKKIIMPSRLHEQDEVGVVIDVTKLDSLDTIPIKEFNKRRVNMQRVMGRSE